MVVKSWDEKYSGLIQGGRVPPPEGTTGTLLLQVYQGFERQLIGALKEGGHPGFRARYGAVLANIDKPSMVELVDEVESKGYVRQEPDPDDRRAKLIYLPSLGWV